jgi:PAS domain S-box-containing protein
LTKPFDRSASDSVTKAPYLSRFMIGRRLTACFISIILLMLVGDALFIWQFYQVRSQADRLAVVDQELIAVLRFQASLHSFYTRLNDLALLEDKDRLLIESDGLHNAVIDDANRTEALFKKTSAGSALGSEVLPTIAAVQSSMPSHLAAFRALASSGDWVALRLRLQTQVLPLEALSSDLVREVDHGVATERLDAEANISRSQNRMIFIFFVTGACTLLIAGALGAGITRSITDPLHALSEASHALATGKFDLQIASSGKDELAQLTVVFDETAKKLGGLYEDLQSREAKLRESAQELQQLIEFLPMHVTVLHPDGTGLYANRVVLEYYGATLEQWQDKAFCNRVMNPEDRIRYMSDLQKGFAGSAPFESEARLLKRNGQFRWFLSRFNPMQDDRGNVLRWYVAQTDIEEAKQETQRTQSENRALREEISRSNISGEILASSDNMLKVLGEIARVARTNSTVLILGETGTGKELVASAIHKQSDRASRPFIRVNCAAIPASLVSSELFGHEKGAFTGAIQRRLGRFEAADGGTIFLDEIGELPAETQVSLLRVLQEREFERVGSNRSISVDVRILAATNRDLHAAVTSGLFRQDLFYRLNVFPIQIPPLRDRPEDIPLLVEYFIEKFAAKGGKKIQKIKGHVFDLFRSYEWPGNIRELQNIVERAVLLCDGEVLSVDDAWFTQVSGKDFSQQVIPLRGLERLESDRERELIEKALTSSYGQISGASGAAAKLGIPRQTLESKIIRLGIDKRKFLVG